jgi:hypothetical protein
MDSLDGGLAWTGPRAVNGDAASETGWDGNPDGRRVGSTAILVWDSDDALGGRLGTDLDILFARSGDGGATWSMPAPIDPAGAAREVNDSGASIATDGAGTWLVLWSSRDDLGGTTGQDLDVLYTVSRDDGLSWEPARALDPDAGIDGGEDGGARAAIDADGRAVVAWISTDPRKGIAGNDPDVLYTSSRDGARTWTHAQPLDPVGAAAPGEDTQAFVATDGEGRWLIVWSSTTAPGAEPRVLVARGALE